MFVMNMSILNGSELSLTIGSTVSDVLVLVEPILLSFIWVTVVEAERARYY